MSLRGLVFLAVIATAGSDAAAEAPPADAAFEAGEYDRALALYEEVLARNPEDVHALVRSGMLLSWRKEYDDALARYDRALALDPGEAKAALERAKVLSWAQRYDESAGAFRKVLSRDPSNREARLGLARVLSWSGKQEEAREEYGRVLETDPGNAEALLGVAQTHAWSGDDGRARPAYQRALEADPGNKDARLGLAYLDLREGDPAAAARTLDGLRADFPEDAEVAALGVEVSRAFAPWIRLGGERLDDTDDNTLNTWILDGGLGFAHGLDLRLAVARYDMTTGDLEGSIDSFAATLGWVPARRHRLEFRAGVDGQHPSTGDDDTVAIGGVLYRFPLSSRFHGRVSWQRDSYRYSVPILDNGIVMDAFDARVDGTFADRWRLEGGLGVWSLNDGNDRKSIDASVLHGWKVRRHTLEAGYGFRGFDWAEDPGNGYFAPDDFSSHLALGRARGPLAKKGYYDVAAEAGVQSFTQGGRHVSADPAFGVYALAGRPLGGGFDLQGYAAWSTSAPQGGENYRARTLGFRIRYRFGGTP